MGIELCDLSINHIFICDFRYGRWVMCIFVSIIVRYEASKYLDNVCGIQLNFCKCFVLIFCLICLHVVGL